jgi:hypothetical protein
MGEIVQPPVLRPLSIGEIFDRAVTLLVRNWATFGIIAAVGILPWQLLNLVTVITGIAVFGAIGALGTAIFPTITALATAAVVAQIYRQEELDWRAALSIGFGRFFRVLGASILIGLMMFIPLAIVLGIGFAAGLFKFANPVADVIAVTFIAAAALWFIAGTLVYAYTVSAIAIDDYGISDSIGKAFELFAGPQAGRALTFALAFALISVGVSFAGSALLAFIATSLHSAPLAYAVNAILLFGSYLVGDALIAVYYFDVRIRREGYDLQVSLDAMESARA